MGKSGNALLRGLEQRKQKKWGAQVWTRRQVACAGVKGNRFDARVCCQGVPRVLYALRDVTLQTQRHRCRLRARSTWKDVVREAMCNIQEE